MAVGKHGGNAEMALGNTILRVRTGSVAHGISTGSSDRDEIGVCIERPEFVIGLRRFEQHGYRDAAERTGKFDAPSEPGDLDLTIYSLRKYVGLALNGNPSMLEILFSTERITCTRAGEQLQALAPLIVSKEALPKYIGYLLAQMRSMQSNNGKGRDVTRPELVELYGYDTKYAGHMVRLGMQGVELASTGKIQLPMRNADASVVLGIRKGKRTLDETLAMATAYLETLRAYESGTIESVLPNHPDRDAVNAWLIETYTRHWGYTGTVWAG